MKDLKPLSKLISLKGKKALVTGGAAGIGKAIAYRLGEAGANLELVDINEVNLKGTKKEFLRLNIKTNIHKLDVSKKEQIDELWKKLEEKEPDILVNNAGIYPFRKFEEIDESFLKKVMDINLTSTFWMCQYMIKQRGKKGGVIINMGSIEAILPFKEDLVPYNMSKAGVISLTRALAKEYAKKGFKINVLVPGGIMTPGTKKEKDKAIKGLFKLKFGVIKEGLEFNWRLPTGRFGTPDEVALMALFLATDLSSYTHGGLMTIDGGFLSS